MSTFCNNISTYYSILSYSVSKTYISKKYEKITKNCIHDCNNNSDVYRNPSLRNSKTKIYLLQFERVCKRCSENFKVNIESTLENL